MDIYRVTQVLGSYADFNSVKADVLALAQARGTIVHQFCSLIAKGLWHPDPPENLRGYITSFKFWKAMAVKKVVFAEERFIDDIYGFSGTPDLGVIMMDDAFTVVDVKTPVSSRKVWAGQVSAYKKLVEPKYGKVDRVGWLRLSFDGRPPIFKPCDYSDAAFAAFLGKLIADRFFLENETERDERMMYEGD